MLNYLSEHVRECLRHAEDCARAAAAQSCPQMRDDFLDLERRWLLLASSYDFTERLANFCAGNSRKADALPPAAQAK